MKTGHCDRRRVRRDRATVLGAGRADLESLEDRRLLAVISGIPEWQPLGPAPIIATIGSEAAKTASGQGVDLSLWSAAGAIGPIAVHPTDANTLYIGSVNGGVWKTETALYSRSDGIDNDNDKVADTLDPDEVPKWTPLTDDFATPISALVFDSLDTTHETLWAGNGRYSSLGREGVATGGLLRTQDGGDTWTELGHTTFQGLDIESIVATDVMTPSGQLVLVAATGAAARAGIYRSVDGGANWTHAHVGNVTSLIQDPTASDRFFAAVPSQGVLQSSVCAANHANCGATWTTFNTGIGNVNVQRMQLAGSSAGTGSVFVSTGVRSAAVSGIAGVFQSVNTGGTWGNWDEIDLPSGLTTISGADTYHRHMAITADPTNQNRVFVSGFREIAVGDGASDTWFKLTTVPPKTQPADYQIDTTNGWMHDDVRDLKIAASGDILMSSDGGVYRVANPYDDTLRHTVSLNGDLAITETNSRFSLAYDSLQNISVLGTQDNGTVGQIVNQSVFDELTHGDGNSTAVGIEGQTSYHYVASNNWKSMKRVQYGATTTESAIKWAKSAKDAAYSGLVRGTDEKISSNTYVPGFVLRLNSITPSRLLLGTRAGLYESTDRGDTITDITPGGVDRSISALAYGGRLGAVNHADVIYAGASNQLWIRTPGSANFGNAIAAYTGTQPIDIVLNPNDWREAYVLDSSSSIWLTTDAGVTWTSLTAGAQLGSLKAIEIAMVANTPVLLAGGAEGLYRRISPTIAGNQDRWSLFGTGLPRVIVLDVVYDATDDLLLAGTLGRGIWTIDHAGNKLNTASTLVINGDLTDDGRYAFPLRDDVIRIAKNPQHDDRLDIFVNDVSGPPQYTVPYGAVDRIQIDAKTGDDFIQVDFLPPHTFLDANGGSGRDVFYTTTPDVQSNINFYGDSEPDWFLITPTASADVYIHGGAPNVLADGDVLRVITDGTSGTVNHGPIPGEGTVDVPGYRSIRYYTTEHASVGAPAWREDTFESIRNDTFVTATDLIEGDQTHVDLTIDKPLDRDWYKWRATNDGWLTIELLFDHALGDLNLSFFDSGLSLLASSTSTTDNEVISTSVTSGKTYYIEVYGVGNDSHPNYTLEIDWPFDVRHDALEANDTLATATNIGSDDQTLKDLTIHRLGEFSSDQDWFKWTAKVPGLMSVESVFQHSLGNLELELYNASQSLIASSTSTTDNEMVATMAAAGNTYYIRVYGWSGSTNPDYDLKIVGAKILPDVLEGPKKNDSALTATDLATGNLTLISLSLDTPEDRDWFEWTATGAAAQANLEVRFLHAVGDIDVRLYDVDLNPIASSAGFADVERISWPATTGATYFIEVYGVGSGNYAYSLAIDWPRGLPVDRFESNDSFAQAANLGRGDFRAEQLTVHEQSEFASNDDYYLWEAWSDGLLQVDIDFLHAAGDLELGLYDASRSLLTSSTSSSNSESVVWQVAPGQQFYIHIYGYSGATCADYTLTIDGPNIYEDVFEPNNDLSGAYDLGMGDQVYEGLSIHAIENDDWYRWTAPIDGALVVDVQHDPDLGNLDLQLHGPDGNILDTSNSAGGGERVESRVAAGDSYYIRVYGVDGAANRYYTLGINGPDIPADRFEPNDEFRRAANVGESSRFLSELSIHEPNNADWYRWTAPIDGTLNLNAYFNDDRGDIDIELYDGLQQLIADSRSTTHDEHLSQTVARGEVYFVKVFGPSTAYIPKVLRGSSITIQSGSLNEHYNLEILFEASDVTGQIIPVAPDPRTTAVASVEFVFSNSVADLPVEEIALTRRTDGVSTIPLAGVSLFTVDQIVWQLNGLAPWTEASGIYTLTLPVGSVGGRLANTVIESWTNLPGDANEDRRFNSSDLIQVLQAGEYEDAVDDNSTWSEGDWDGDGDFTTTDLIFALQAGGYAVDAVPTPVLLWAGAVDRVWAELASK